MKLVEEFQQLTKSVDPEIVHFLVVCTFVDPRFKDFQHHADMDMDDMISLTAEQVNSFL